jgi:hypothetical protein
VSSKQAAQHFVLHEKYPDRFADLVLHIETFWGQNTCEVKSCNVIGADSAIVIHTSQEMNDFYSLAYVSSGYPE